jgi:hypothetical protein
MSYACVGFVILLATPARGSEASRPQSAGRGWVVGIGLGGGGIKFDGASDLAAVIGGPIGTLTLPGGGTTTLVAGEIVSLDIVPLAGDHIVPIPSHQRGGSVSLQVGRSLSNRFALLADIDLMAAWSDSIRAAWRFPTPLVTRA